MKTRFYTFVACLLSAFAMQAHAQEALGKDSVIMGPSYANDIYYSMANGEVFSYPRNTWDIAFRTGAFSSSIITNDGQGVVVWTYPNADTSGWSSVDTAGLSTWTPMYNDPEDWENGAFSRNALGHPDYGWCVYNAITHNLHGDSLFIVKTRNGNFLKVFLKMKNSLMSKYYFRYANLDGSNSQDVEVNGQNYGSKDYVGFDFATGQDVDFQAPKADWDLVFTKYMSVQPNGTPYPVTGVLSNPAIGVTEYRGVNQLYGNWGVEPWDQTRQPIGWDWKVFDMGNMTWIVEDSLVYFVMDRNGDVHKLIFDKFSGSGSGKIVFYLGTVSAVGLESSDAGSPFVLYPNPSAGAFRIRLPEDIRGTVAIRISDLSGRLVHSSSFDISNSGSGLNLTTSLHPGMYVVRLSSGSYSASARLVIK